MARTRYRCAIDVIGRVGSGSGPKARKATAADDLDPADQGPVRALRTAPPPREQDVPAYVVFKRHLQALAAHRPVTLDQPGAISGIGEKKTCTAGHRARPLPNTG